MTKIAGVNKDARQVGGRLREKPPRQDEIEQEMVHSHRRGVGEQGPGVNPAGANARRAKKYMCMSIWKG